MPTGKHLFDQECAEHSIEHLLIKPRKSQTNGMAERLNGRIKEIVQQTRFESAQQLEETLIRYLDIYNSNIPQRNLGHVTPMEALSKWRKTHPDLFEKSESNHQCLDTNLQPAISADDNHIFEMSVDFIEIRTATDMSPVRNILLRRKK